MDDFLAAYQQKRKRVLQHIITLQKWVDLYDDVVDELYATFQERDWRIKWTTHGRRFFSEGSEKN